MSESPTVQLPPHPVEPMVVAKVRIDGATTALYQLAAGSGVERWRRLSVHPAWCSATPMWASWQGLHELGDVTVLREVPPAPMWVSAEDGARRWSRGADVWLDPLSSRVSLSVGHDSDAGYAGLSPADARELAATLLDLASEAEASPEHREMVRASRARHSADPATAAVHEAVSRRG